MTNIDIYNNILSEIYFENFPYSLYSSTLSRAEGQSNFYIKKVKINPLIIFINIFIFLAKVLRDFIFTLTVVKIDIEKIKNKKLIISYFDDRSFNNKYYNDDYFRDILIDEEDIIVIYKLIKPGIYKNGKRLLNIIYKEIPKKYFIISEYSIIRLNDIIYSIIYSIKIFFNLFYNISRNKFLSNSIFTKNQLLFKIIIEFSNGTFYFNALNYRLYKKVCCNNPSLILYPWESLPWERILQYVAYENKSIKTRGFQHTGFSKLLLQHFPCKLDLKLPIFPNEIICNGIINQEVLKKSKIISDIKFSRALRQNHLLNHEIIISKFPNIIKNGITNILVTLNYNINDYHKIYNIFNKIDENINVYFKIHPLNIYKYPKISKKNFHYILNLKELDLNIIDIILSHDNSWIFESFFYNKHSIAITIHEENDLRDYNSPILHVNEDNISDILHDTKKIYKNTIQIIEEKYLNKYFCNYNITQAKIDFLNV